MNVKPFYQEIVLKISSILIMLTLLTSPISRLKAQEPDAVNQQFIEDMIENLAASTDEELDYTSLFNDLSFYAAHPLNLNAASSEDLEKLHILNDFQIKSLQKYIKDNGQLLTLFELQYVYGFTDELVQQLLPFITLETEEKPNPLRAKNILQYGQHELFVRGQRVLETQKGYVPLSDSVLAENPDKARYLGSPYKIYTRYRFNYSKRVLFGITAEKDAGEEFFKGSNRQGFDFYSAHLQLNDIGPLKSLIVGDYHIQTGQGLTLWSGLSFGKSSNAIAIRKMAQGIRRNTSAEENLFFRGVAATLEAGNFEFTGFFSKKKRDANFTDTLDDGTFAYSSLLTTGYHSTPPELNDEKLMDEMAAGGNITFHNKFLKIGFTAVHYRLDGWLQPNDQLSKKYTFSGNQLTNIGIDYQTGGEKWQLFGETSYGNGSIGTLTGAMFFLHPKVYFSAFYRNYQKSYYALYSCALSESSENNNEKGLYFGTEIHPGKSWKITAYFDAFAFPWLQYQVSSPSRGNECHLQINYTPSALLGMDIRFRRQFKPKNQTAAESVIQTPQDILSRKFRYHIYYAISENLVMKDRLEWCRIDKENNGKSDGWLIYHDITWKLPRMPFSMAFRYALFDTDDYDSRIYAFENDVLNAFSIPAYNYKGTRTYFLLKYEITKFMDLWLRYAVTNYADRNVTGSGLTEINGNTKSEIKIQLRVRI